VIHGDVTGRNRDRNFRIDEIKPQSQGGSELNIGGCVASRLVGLARSEEQRARMRRTPASIAAHVPRGSRARRERPRERRGS
jgi:hypothetical protein